MLRALAADVRNLYAARLREGRAAAGLSHVAVVVGAAALGAARAGLDEATWIRQLCIGHLMLEHVAEGFCTPNLRRDVSELHIIAEETVLACRDALRHADLWPWPREAEGAE